MSGGATSTVPAIDIADLVFGYKTGETILSIDSFQVARGERVFLHGPSGSGKTTLLGILAGILVPASGRVRLLGEDLPGMSSGARDLFRGAHIGYIFQMFNLIPYLSVLDNILLPCRLMPERQARVAGDLEAEAHRIAAALEIEALLERSVAELSVGQQQRVAAARAFAGAPELIIADEPTSALDTDLRDRFLELLLKSAEAANMTVVFVSHDHTLKARFDRDVSLKSLQKQGAVA